MYPRLAVTVSLAMAFAGCLDAAPNSPTEASAPSGDPDAPDATHPKRWTMRLPIDIAPIEVPDVASFLSPNCIYVEFDGEHAIAWINVSLEWNPQTPASSSLRLAFGNPAESASSSGPSPLILNVTAALPNLETTDIFYRFWAQPWIQDAQMTIRQPATIEIDIGYESRNPPSVTDIDSCGPIV